ncbi:MAG TPA: FecR domain-containing protein [Prolixibacteraceae bacterium]|nr:FecR domain-containing protein [Prolixibacteraceae bacterium]
MNEEKLIRYIKGEFFSDAEILEILHWIESAPENQKTYNHLKNLWVVTGFEYPDEVNVPDFNFPKTKSIFLQKTGLSTLLKYAAVFILAFSLGTASFYFMNSNQQKELANLYNTIDVPYGERSRITLYDGTRVWLNSGTKFRYPVVFSPQTRDVYMQGEAYFDVAKDSKHPFIVNAGQLKVEVLGTHFNVCAYTDDNEFSATLEEGSVNAVNTSSGKSMIIKPGEQVVVNREANNLKRQEVNTELFTSWKENLLKFEDAPFEDVIKKMERWYDVNISVDPAIDTKERYTMTIKTESLREMLQLVTRTTNMKYEINENNVVLKKP